MNILHLNSYYIDNHLYSQLYGLLDLKVKQRVYIPIKTDRKPENLVDFERTELIFQKIILPYHKFNYFGKVRTITNNLIKSEVHKDIDFVHAHNLFTDGAIAYTLNKKYGLKYIVAVRTTDIGLQYKYMFHRRFRIHHVLMAAEQIVFISPTYRDKLFSMMPSSVKKKIAHKVQIIPNGVDDIWLTNLKNPIGTALKPPIKLLYVGQIMKRKNVFALLEAVASLNEKHVNKFLLTVIGGENVYEPEYMTKFLEKVELLDWLAYKGKIYDKNELLKEFRQSDIFVMPSKGELFGLVYIEALSQGKPVLYSNGEGINGFLENKSVGEAVDPNNIEDIADGIIKICESYASYSNFEEVVLPFNWSSIVDIYIKMYQNT